MWVFFFCGFVGYLGVVGVVWLVWLVLWLGVFLCLEFVCLLGDCGWWVY